MFGQAPTPSLVLTLLKGRSPAAVVGSVRTVVVDPLDRQPRRRFAHVFKESLKAGAPAAADRNASAAVVLEPLVLGVGAALFHRCPAFEGGRAPAPMYSDAGAQLFTMKTAATHCEAGGHGRHRDGFFSATVALTKPNSSFEFVSIQNANSDKSAKPLAGDIFESRHAVLPQRRRRLETALRSRAGPSCCFDISWGGLQ
jgi:hypothetical protein